MNPLVSVIIPVFNSGEFLEETIASVNTQTYKSVEIIVIDNGSDDQLTLDILKKLDASNQVLYSGKTGLCVARNEGLKAAKGKYILPLDSDDIIKPTFIEKCVKLIESDSSIKVVRTQIELFGAKSGTIIFEPFTFPLLLARNMMVVTSLFKRADAIEFGGFDPTFEKTFEDWDFWINLLKNGGSVATIDDCLFRYRIRRKSKNHSLKINDLKEGRKQIWNKYKSLYAIHFVDPTETFEYKYLIDSKANKLGNMLLKPFSRFKLIN